MPNLGRELVGDPVAVFGPPQPEHDLPAVEQAEPSPLSELPGLPRDFLLLGWSAPGSGACRPQRVEQSGLEIGVLAAVDHHGEILAS